MDIFLEGQLYQGVPKLVFQYLPQFEKPYIVTVLHDSV